MGEALVSMCAGANRRPRIAGGQVSRGILYRRIPASRKSEGGLVFLEDQIVERRGEGGDGDAQELRGCEVRRELESLPLPAAAKLVVDVPVMAIEGIDA